MISRADIREKRERILSWRGRRRIIILGTDRRFGSLKKEATPLPRIERLERGGLKRGEERRAEKGEERQRERQRILAVLISTPMNPARNELEEEEASREQTKCLLQFR